MLRFATFSSMLLALSFATTASAYDCNSECRDVGRYHYPCPSWDNLNKMCLGNDPIEVGACYAEQEVSCKLWQSAVTVVEGKVKSLLSTRFNRIRWQAATESGMETDYMDECVAAGIAVLSAIGAEVEAPWGAVIGGTAGAFVAHRLCQQSRSW